MLNLYKRILEIYDSGFQPGEEVTIKRYKPPVKGRVSMVTKHSPEELGRDETVQVMSGDGKLEWYSPSELEHCPKNEARNTTFTFEIIAELSKVPSLKRIDSWAIADGTVGLFRYSDGNAYEIEVRPISQGKHKNLWGDKLKKREDRV